MNQSLGNAMAVGVFILLLVTTVLYIVNPDSAASPTITMLIRASMGGTILFSVGLAVMVIRDNNFHAR